jgi:hypothetical protein
VGISSLSLLASLGGTNSVVTFFFWCGGFLMRVNFSVLVVVAGGFSSSLEVVLLVLVAGFLSWSLEVKMLLLGGGVFVVVIASVVVLLALVFGVCFCVVGGLSEFVGGLARETDAIGSSMVIQGNDLKCRCANWCQTANVLACH